MLFAHGPITEKDGDRGKCRKCGEWYDLPDSPCVQPHKSCEPWNPECWHPPKVLGENHVGWLLGAIPLYRHPEPVPDPNAPKVTWTPKPFPAGSMGPFEPSPPPFTCIGSWKVPEIPNIGDRLEFPQGSGHWYKVIHIVQDEVLLEADEKHCDPEE